MLTSSAWKVYELVGLPPTPRAFKNERLHQLPPRPHTWRRRRLMADSFRHHVIIFVFVTVVAKDNLRFLKMLVFSFRRASSTVVFTALASNRVVKPVACVGILYTCRDTLRL